MTNPSSVISRAQAAQRYAAAHWHIFPCWWADLDGCGCGNTDCTSPGKHPITLTGAAPRWGTDATDDPATVDTWWTRWPKANIGVSLGPSRLFVVDVDGPRGRATLDQLEKVNGPLPATLIVDTGRAEGDGAHHYFAQPDGEPIGNGKLGDHLDLKGAGGYVIAPPSGHASGRAYLWRPAPTGAATAAQAPEWLLNMTRKPAPTPPTAPLTVTPPPPTNDAARQLATKRLDGQADKVASAAEGDRNNTLNWAAHEAGRLVAVGLLDETHVTAVLTDAAARAGLTDQEARATIRSGLTAGRAKPDHDALHTPARPDVPALPPFDPQIERDFWDARPELAHLRLFARARRVSPWALLGVALTRMIVTVPPSYVLPGIIGGQASLNLFSAIVARSGGGKGASEAAAAEALLFNDEFPSCGVGSGEGILHQFCSWKPPDKKTGDPGMVVQHNDRVLFTAGEVDTLGALHSRQSSTLLSELRKVYMGEALSFAYVDPTKRLKLDRHTYRACLIVGVQPARAGVLLDDADGGTPQRFAWLPGTDADMPDVAPAEPDPLPWARPVSAIIGASGRHVLHVCAEALDTIDQEHVKRNRGDGDALDGHALLTRLKWAAALGFLQQRVGVNVEDWQLAGAVMQISDHTRQQVLASLQAAKASANAAKGHADAARALIAEEVAAEAGIHRVVRLVLSRVADGDAWAHHQLRKCLASRDRGYFDAAITRLTDTGQIEAITDRQGTVYKASGKGLPS